jgi:hypothetical protein
MQLQLALLCFALLIALLACKVRETAVSSAMSLSHILSQLADLYFGPPKRYLG